MILLIIVNAFLVIITVKMGFAQFAITLASNAQVHQHANLVRISFTLKDYILYLSAIV